MSFVYRQSPSEINAQVRRNSLRAAAGLVGCIASLVGLSMAATHEVRDRITAAQEVATDRLQPPAVRREAKQNKRTAHILAAHTSELTPSNDLPLKLVGGAAIVAYAGLVGFGFVGRRNRERDANGFDVATQDNYHLYPFEQPTSPVLYDVASADQLDQRIAAADQKADVTLMKARLNSDLNWLHLKIIRENDGPDPLHVFTYHA